MKLRPSHPIIVARPPTMYTSVKALRLNTDTWRLRNSNPIQPKSERLNYRIPRRPIGIWPVFGPAAMRPGEKLVMLWMHFRGKAIRTELSLLQNWLHLLRNRPLEPELKRPPNGPLKQRSWNRLSVSSGRSRTWQIN